MSYERDDNLKASVRMILIGIFRLLFPPSKINLLGDRDVEYSWILANMPSGPGKALDFGSGSSYIGLAAAQAGFDVTAIDLVPVKWPYRHPGLKFMQVDIIRVNLKPESLDLVTSCSVVEHVGLPGRYNIEMHDPDGDLKAMARVLSLLKPGGIMLMTIPVGQDKVHISNARVYGEKRLPRLLEGYDVEKDEYWIKNRDNNWIPVSREEALRFEASFNSIDPLRNACAIGCFLLKRRHGR